MCGRPIKEIFNWCLWYCKAVRGSFGRCCHTQFENSELAADFRERKKKEKERKSAQMENVKIILMCELYIINRQKDEDAAVKKKQ